MKRLSAVFSVSLLLALLGGCGGGSGTSLGELAGRLEVTKQTTVVDVGQIREETGSDLDLAGETIDLAGRFPLLPILTANRFPS